MKQNRNNNIIIVNCIEELELLALIMNPEFEERINGYYSKETKEKIKNLQIKIGEFKSNSIF